MSINQFVLKKLVRARELSEEAISAFDDPMMALTMDGQVYFANRRAKTLLKNLNLPNRLPYLLEQLANPVLKGGEDFISKTFVNAISLPVNGKENLFLPFIFGTRDETGTLAGATLVLHDLTKLRRQLGIPGQPASLKQVVGLSERMRLISSRN
jgi:transcriptional regulator of aromatic amino acid metabolism